jgi:hypothetical protein
VDAIKDLIQRLRKLEAEISREASENVSTGINYNDLESQPAVRLNEEDFNKYTSQQVVQMQK